MKNTTLLWADEFKPTCIEDIYMDNYIRDEMCQIQKNGEFHNLLLTGSPGVGKTLAIATLAKSIYEDMFHEYVLELNSSHDRGIKVKDIIYTFCKKTIYVPNSKHKQKKLIIFEEADYIMENTQRIISEMMETYKDETAFVLICHVSTNIIESIQSRCKTLHFARLSKKHITERLSKICEMCNIYFDIDGTNEIAATCDGDMRAAINMLQLVVTKHKNKKKIVTEDNVIDVCDGPHRKMLADIVNLCVDSKVKDVLKIILSLKSMGYTGIDIANGLFNVLREIDFAKVNKTKHMKMAEVILKGSYNLSKIDSDLQIFAIICELCSIRT